MQFTSKKSKTSLSVESAMLKKKQLIIYLFPNCDRIIDILTCRHQFCVANFNIVTLVPKESMSVTFILLYSV